MTYQLHGNILNIIYDKNLWKITLLKEAENRLKVVTLRPVRNGKLAARRVVKEGIYAMAS
jgi:hypothetical protein